MKQYRICAIVLLAALLCACATAPTPTFAPAATPMVFDLNGAPVRLHLDSLFWGDDIPWERTERLLQESGYAIALDGIEMKMVTDEEYYTQYLREFLQEPNSIVLIKKGYYYNKLLEYDVMGDLPAAAAELAPDFYALMAPYMEETQPLAFPSSNYSMNNFRRPGLLIREDIWAAYGQQIETWADYVTFLEWVSATYEDVVPGLIPLDNYLDTYLASSCNTPLFDLMMAEEDLYNMGNIALPPRYRLYLYADANGNVEPVERNAGFQASVNEACELARTSVIEFAAGYGLSPVAAEKSYASMLMSASDFLFDPLLQHSLSYFSLRYDASGYRFHLPGKTAAPRIPTTPNNYDYVAIMGKDCDPSEFLRFLARVHTDPAFYQSLMLGEEGADYTNVDGYLEPRDSAAEYPYPSALAPLLSLRMDAHLPLSGTPSGYFEELLSIDYPKDDDRYAIAFARMGPYDAQLQEYAQARHGHAAGLASNIRAAQTIGQEHFMWDDIHLLLEEINGG